MTTPWTMYTASIQKAQKEWPTSPGSIQMATSAEMARNTRALASQRSVLRISLGVEGGRRLHSNRR